MLWLWSLLIPAAPDLPSTSAQSANDGPFKAVVVTVPDLDQFYRQWAVQTEGAEITSTTKLVRGQPAYVVVLFGGCVPNDLAKCRIEVRPKITTPDGQPYGELDGRDVWPGQDVPVDRPDAFFLAPQLLGIRIEPGESLGPYRMELRVADAIAGRAVNLQQTLIAVEAE